MIERVVENWLTSANERQYQIPFCQLLAAEGETILYISPHSQMEQGKDVITRAATGRVRAYQLKGGSVNLADWRRYKGEIDELVIYPIDHPSVKSSKMHDPFFVTNGSISDTVLNAIKSANKAWSKQGGRPLTPVAGQELVSRFVKAHGKFLPRDPQDFVRFLELIVDSGRAPLDKSKLASFLESILPLEASGKKPIAPHEIQRSAASALLLTTYIIQGAEKNANHWAVFEAWIVVAASIAMVAQKHAVPLSTCDSSLSLCLQAAARSLTALAEECNGNELKFTQGDPFTDGEFYASRITILCGLLSAGTLGHRITQEHWEYENFIHDFLIEYLPRVRLWGESAVPYLALAALECERHGHHKITEGLILQLVHTIANVNGAKGRGLPNPYYGPEESIRIANQLDRFNGEVFVGNSYTLEALIQFLARRWDRRQIASVWEKVTHVDFARVDVTEDWEFLRWRATNGTLVTQQPPMPQSWAQLLGESEKSPNHRWPIFKAYPQFGLFFSMVYPHRFTPELLKIIEEPITRS